MSLNVETGSGSPSSDSFASVADANAYLAARGQSSWEDVETVDKESALRRATDYMQQVYRGRWGGTRTSMTQALDWPRYLVPVKDAPAAFVVYYESNIIPSEVKSACIALALKAAAGDLAPDIQPAVASESVGSISVSYAPGRQTVRYQAIDNMLSPLLKDGGSGSMAMLVRA